MSQFRIGNFTVERVEEMLTPGSPPGYLFKSFEPTSFYAENPEFATPDFLDPETQRLMSSMHAWLVRDGRNVILVDTASGNHKTRPEAFRRFNQLDNPFMENLAKAGIKPDDVTHVINTHFHVDHVGWNTILKDGAWVPAFPKARYYFPKIEFDYWIDSDAGVTKSPDAKSYLDDSVIPIYDAGLVDHIGGGDEVVDGLEVVHSPGHTPGQVTLYLRSDGDVGVFSGDVLHQINQVPHPEWHCRFDEDPALAYQSRMTLLENAIKENAVVFPAHFGFPHASKLARRGTGFRMVL